MIRHKKRITTGFAIFILGIISVSLFLSDSYEHMPTKQPTHVETDSSNDAPLIITETYQPSEFSTPYPIEQNVVNYSTQPASTVTASISVPTQVPLSQSTQKPTMPTITPALISINGVTSQEFVVMPYTIVNNACDIYTHGQYLGRDPNHFSILGDSEVATSHFLTHFETDSYDLAEYSQLQNVIDHFRGSFGRQSVAVRKGLNSSAVLDPMWANKELCQANETMLSCEFRLHNPAVLLIILGTNDWTEVFEENIVEIVSFSSENGVIPVLVTKSNRVDGYNSPRNQILRQVAIDYQIPLWDYDLIADTLPDRGLDIDGVHMLIFPENDYALAQALQSGYGTYNLSAIVLLDLVWRNVIMTGCN